MVVQGAWAGAAGRGGMGWEGRGWEGMGWALSYTAFPSCPFVYLYGEMLDVTPCVTEPLNKLLNNFPWVCACRLTG